DLEIPNANIQWRLGQCTRWKMKEFKRMREEIVQSARLQGLKLQWPFLGIIPKPVSQWIPSIFPSALHVIEEVYSNPGTLVSTMNRFELLDRSTSDKEDLFNKALLRRAYLAKKTENPEFPAYKCLFSKIYAIVSPVGLIAAGFIVLAALGLLITGTLAVG